MYYLLDSARAVTSLPPQQLQKAGFVTTAVIISSYVFYRVWSSESDNSCPVVPYTNPFYGSSAEFYKDPKEFVEKWTDILGPVYRIHTVVSGKYAQEVFRNDSFSFVTGNLKRLNINLLTGTSDEEIATRCEALYGVVSRHFYKRTKEFETGVVVNLYEGVNDHFGSAAVRHLYPMFLRMITRAVAFTILGEDLCKNNELIDLFQNITADLLSSSSSTDNTWVEPFTGILKLRLWAIGKFFKVSRNYRRRLYLALVPEIDSWLKKMQDPNWKRPDDALQGSMEYKIPPVNAAAGKGTVMLYRLLQNPAYMEEIQREQQEVLQHLNVDTTKNHAEIFTTDVVKNMEKLDSLCRETLRHTNMYYGYPHTNISVNEVVLNNGVVIKPGTDVLINMHYNHKVSNPFQKVAGGDPAEFKAFRHVNTGKQAVTLGDDDYLTFGVGKSACPGRYFTVYAMKAAISMLIRDYEIHPDGDPVFPTAYGTFVPNGSAIFTKRHR